MTITLPGPTPSKKNSKQIVCRGSRPILLSSERYQAWEEEQLWRLKSVKQRFTKPVRIDFTLYEKTLQRSDLSNRYESVADLLVKAGVIQDDDCQHVPEVHMKYGGKDKENPRAEIDITQIST